MNNRSQLEQQQLLRQQQRINPRQVAMGRVLEMSAPEFEEEVRRELSENPALAAADVSHHSDPDSDNFTESAEQLQRADYGNEDDVPYYMRNASNHSADDEHFDATAIAEDDDESMIDVLMAHLRDDFSLTPAQLIVGKYIIGNLDNNGYLTRSLESIRGDLAIAENIEPNTEDMDVAYNAVRSLDPAGIGAKDLRDCLLLQLQRREQDENVQNAYSIIDKHFEDFSHRHFERLQQTLGIERTALARAFDLIRTLNPRPGSAFGSIGEARIRHITPDFFLEYDEESDRFSLSLADNVPELTIEESFRSDSTAFRGPLTAQQREAAEYIRVRRDSANAFIALARQRAMTLTTIGRAIVYLQRKYFISGNINDLKPMVLRDVSEQAKVSLSTVSRAISGKYMQTPHGLVAMKSLFNEATGANNDTASPAILKILSDVIDAEDKSKPLTDEQLTVALAAKGHKLARRTVAKYREKLGLPTARLRKQL